jgi:hypothetical protein
MAKHIKLWEQYTNENSEIPLGTKVKTNMGIRRTGVVIPWFYWKDATDGTYSQPDREDYVAVQWDNGEKGFSAISNIVVMHRDGTEEELGRVISDEEYDTTPDDFEVEFSSDSSGYIEFSDGSSDSFIIYDDGRIAFDGWYPEEKNKKLIDKINSIKSNDLNESVNKGTVTIKTKDGKLHHYPNFKKSDVISFLTKNKMNQVSNKDDLKTNMDFYVVE